MSALKFFPIRKAEPAIMGDAEMREFEKLSKANAGRWITPLLDVFFGRSGLRDGIVADIACGPGVVSKALAQRARKISVIGIDISDHALRLARRNCRALPNASFKKGSVYHLPLLDASVDAVLCKDSLHHFDDPARAMREMYRILRPGGYMLLQDLRRDLPEYLIKRSIKRRTMVEKLQYYSTRAAYTKKEVRSTLTALRLKPLYLATPKVTSFLLRRYTKLEIDPTLLREGFQARYNLLVRKA